MPSESRIEIRQSWCKGCEFCVGVCTGGVLRMDDGKPVVGNAEDCTGCELCVWICPDFAITITKEADESNSPAEN